MGFARHLAGPGASVHVRQRQERDHRCALDEVAAALAVFFEGGAGPSPDTLDRLFERAGLAEVDPRRDDAVVGKMKRIRAVLWWASENDEEAGAALVKASVSALPCEQQGASAQRRATTRRRRRLRRWMATRRTALREPLSCLVARSIATWPTAHGDVPHRRPERVWGQTG